MYRFIIIPLFLIISHVFAYANSDDALCKKVEIIAHEAEMLHNTFNDPESARALSGSLNVL